MSEEERDEYGVTPAEYAAARRYLMEIAWSPPDNAFLASFPDVPGLRAHGSTEEAAAAMGEEVIVAWYTAMKDASRPIPEPSCPVATARQRNAGSPPSV